MPAHSPKYPVYLDIADKNVLVVGGGSVAARKAETLLSYGASVLVIAPEADAAIAAACDDPACTLRWERREFAPGDCAGMRLVFCATNSERVNRAVFADAHEYGALANVVDVPPLCDFSVPSIVDRGLLQIAVSTSGASPAVARRVRERLEAEFGPEWEEYLALLSEIRGEVLGTGELDEDERREVFERIAAADLLGRIRDGEHPSALEVIQQYAGDAR
jgi:precorrin-2 dehydrogenase/sirohydrochlorin ferrochelatase